MIDYEEDWIIFLLFRTEGSVALRASFFALPAAIIGVLLLYLDEWYPHLRSDLGMHDVGASQIWNATVGVMIILLGFRTKQGLARFWEGTGLLHQMRGEWFDTVSNCVTFSIGAKAAKPIEVMSFRHALVRLMSLAHGSALEEIAGNLVQLDSIDAFGLDSGTLRHLKECHEEYHFNKVEVMLHLVQSLITKAHDDGVLKIPPPILSRVYQTISRGFVNLLNAKKITDTRFPFPFAQLMSFLLYALTFLTPLMLACHIKSKILLAIFTFIPIFGMCSLNFISIELENPFGTDRNDLPLENFQSEMNSCLLMLLHHNTDLIATTSDDCMTDFNSLYAEICPHLVHVSARESNVDGGTSRRKTRLSHFKDEPPTNGSTKKSQTSQSGEGEEMTVQKVSFFGRASESISTAAMQSITLSTALSSAKQPTPTGAKDPSVPQVIMERVDITEEPVKSEPERASSPNQPLQSARQEPPQSQPLQSARQEPPQSQPLQMDRQESAQSQEPKAEVQVAEKLTSQGETSRTATGPVSGPAVRPPVAPPVAMPQPPKGFSAVKEMTFDSQPGAFQDLEPLLAKTAQEFGRSMEMWTATIELQVNELQRNCDMLKMFNETMSAAASSNGPHGWEGSVPGV